LRELPVLAEPAPQRAAGGGERKCLRTGEKVVKGLLFNRIYLEGDWTTIYQAPKFPLDVHPGPASSPFSLRYYATLSAEQALQKNLFVFMPRAGCVSFRVALQAVLRSRGGCPIAGFRRGFQDFLQSVGRKEPARWQQRTTRQECTPGNHESNISKAEARSQKPEARSQKPEGRGDRKEPARIPSSLDRR
jgi:hypothetical protein